jgi:hypothetical protein
MPELLENSAERVFTSTQGIFLRQLLLLRRFFLLGPARESRRRRFAAFETAYVQAISEGGFEWLRSPSAGFLLRILVIEMFKFLRET